MFEGLDNAYPLTPLQQGMLYEGLKNPDSNVYVAYIVIDIIGELDLTLFKTAWQRTVEQHETLRTRFLWEGLEVPLQLVNSSVELDWAVCDPDQAPGQTRESMLEHWLEHERAQPLLLTNTPPIRFRLMRLSDNQHTLIWTVHHLLADDWSTPLVLQSVADHYHRCLTSPRHTGIGASLHLPFVTYVDWLAGDNQARHEQWWMRKLEKVEPTSIRPAYSSPGYDTAPETPHHRHASELGRELSSSLVELSRALGVTQSSILHAAWALVIARFSGHDQALFGTSVSGRTCPLPGIDTAVGLFLNTLPTHIQIDASQRLDDFIRSVQRQLFEQLEHEHVSLVELQKLLPVDEKRLAFESVLVVETHGPELLIDVEDSDISLGNIRYYTDSNFPLTVLVFPGESTEVHLVGTEMYFDRGVFSALSAEFVALLTDICRPEVSQLTQVLDLQSQRIGSYYPPALAIDQPAYTSIADWIKNTALDQAASIAVIDEDRQFTYAQLLSLAEKIARVILERDSSSPFIGICMERGFPQIAAILGVLLSGKAYVPIDPEWPRGRLDEIIDSAHIDLVISDKDTGIEAFTPNVSVVLPDQLEDDADGSLVAQQRGHGDDPAYMIFTSGSTGRPKGVVISHQNLVYSTSARIAYYPDTPAAFLLLSPFVFDSSVAGIFWTLCSGGSLVLPGNGNSHDIHNLELQISRHRVTHTLCLPSIYTLLLRYGSGEALKSLDTVIVAGEVCPPGLPALSREALPHTRLYNEYGPTEATVWSTVAQLNPAYIDPDSPAPIGHPIPGTQIRVTSETGEICPPGTSGELHVTGPGVARGYYGDSQLTLDRFESVQDGSDLRTYKTGDMVSLGFDGQLYFLGRTDHQLKIRGHRIEAGEITSRAERHPDVLEAVCLLQDFSRPGAGEVTDKRLVCFHTLTARPASQATGCHLIDDPDYEALIEDIQESTRDLIKRELPAQFEVFQFVAVNRLPRLPNGKINLAGFPSISNPGASARPEIEPVAATDGVEARLCRILAPLLGIPAVPPGENFFTLGGDSLTAIRFVAAAREQGIELTVPMLTTYVTMGELANAPELVTATTLHTETIVSHGEAPLTPIQRWFFSRGQSRLSHWNMAFVVTFRNAASASDVTEAIRMVIGEYPVLGTRFVNTQDGMRQYIPESIQDGALLRKIQPPGSLAEWVDALSSVQHDFDLESGIVMRCLVAENEASECLEIGVVLHHLVTDALSNWQISRRINQLLKEGGKGARKGVPPVSYHEWSTRLQRELPISDGLGTAVHVKTVGPWTEERASIHTLEVSKAQLTAIRQHCEQHAVALHEYLLFVLLSSGMFTGETRVDMETHGRDLLEPKVDASAAIGWFTSFFPIMVPPIQDTDLKRFRGLLRRGKEENAGQFARNPENYFSTPDGVPKLGSGKATMALLYNFLAMEVTNSGRLEREGFSLNPLTDACFRDPQSPRSHPIELLVTDHPDGLALTWRVDETIAGRIGLSGWIERCRARLRELETDPANTEGAVLAGDFPDSGMDADELSHFLDELD